MANKTGRKQLTLKQAFQVKDWLHCDAAELEAESRTMDQAAAMASKELGFTVTDRQLERVAVETELRWKPKRDHNSSNRRFAELEKRLAHLEALSELSNLVRRNDLKRTEDTNSQLAVLRGALTFVAQELGIPLAKFGLVATNASDTCVANSK